MAEIVRHITPGLGSVPRDLKTEPCSGLVGVAIGTAEAQASRGYMAQLFGWNPSPGDKSWMIGNVEARAVRGWDWARLGPYDFRVTAPLIRLSQRAGAPHYVHAYTDPHLLLTRARSKRLLHFQTPVPERPSWTYTRLVNRADAVICCSKFIRDQFLTNVDFPEQRVFEVNNGLDLKRFASLDGASKRSEWGVDQDEVVVLFAGALVPEKGLLYLLKALQSLETDSRVRLVVAGSTRLWITPEATEQTAHSKYLESLQSAATGLSVEWLGAVSQDQMPHVYAAADICVVPSVWDEPFGLVASEAAAAGKAVIATNRGGLPQIIEDGETGFLVAPASSQALQSALDTLVDNPALRQTLGETARQRSSRFDWTNVAAQIDSIYQALDDPAFSVRSHEPEPQRK
jgi:glycosyltransferase involved in cell wall biosynthesis